MDWNGNKNSIYKTIGATNHTDKEREKDDFYATDPVAIDILLKDGGIKLTDPVWECACGDGCLAKRLNEYGYNAFASDLVERGYGYSGIDFLSIKARWPGDIVTNPPYKYAQEFVEHALELVEDGNKVIMFLKLTFLEGKKRKELFRKYPPKYLLVSSSRILCAKNADFDRMRAGGGSAVAYGWYVWEKGYDGETVLKWVN